MNLLIGANCWCSAHVLIFIMLAFASLPIYKPTGSKLSLYWFISVWLSQTPKEQKEPYEMKDVEIINDALFRPFSVQTIFCSQSWITLDTLKGYFLLLVGFLNIITWLIMVWFRLHFNIQFLIQILWKGFKSKTRSILCDVCDSGSQVSFGSLFACPRRWILTMIAFLWLFSSVYF